MAAKTVELQGGFLKNNRAVMHISLSVVSKRILLLFFDLHTYFK
jgi:hypothetical protein